ncbi:MAG: methionyl-tRNA formyltransferase [Rhizobiales bacterium]|nr:methionyl-tRNA formyltransferase [Hyphomicrobiales bacterium]
MFDTIILLTGSTEQPVLGDVLLRRNPQLTIRPVTTSADLDGIKPYQLRRSRLIGFATAVVVPARILKTLGYGAYNFHPGPPNYPGRTPAHFAIYDRATEFGVTAHVMIERVDAGPIVGNEQFAIPPNTDLTALCELSFRHTARLFGRLSKELATRTALLPELPIRWCGRKSTKNLYARMCDIPLDIAKDELERRIAAFGTGQFGIDPTVTLHGHRFAYVKDETPMSVDAPSMVPEQPLVEAAE